MRLNSKAKSEPWRQLAQLECARRDETIGFAESGLPEITVPTTGSVLAIPRQVLGPLEFEITETPVERLLASLASGEISSLMVLSAFMQRARVAHRLTNCLTSFLPERAVLRAQYLDSYLADHKKPIGPLHGLPFSVAECLAIKDLDTTSSFIGWLGRTSNSDASIVRILEELGGTVFARTTQGQGLSMFETASNLYGTTTNPHNVSLTPGGSSGGEGALLALKGSPLGIGAEFGGSNSVPATHCGLYSFRPTSGRIPATGLVSHRNGCEAIPASIGPLASSLSGIRLFLQSVVGSRPWESDPILHQIEWRDENAWLAKKLESREKLRIGVIWDDGVVKPLPPVLRALTEVVSKLRALSKIEVVDFEQDYRSGHDLFTKLISPDAGAKFQEILDLSGEPWQPLASWTNREMPGIEKLVLTRVWEYTSQRDAYRHAYFKRWQGSGVDLVLSPVAADAASRHDQGHSRYSGYTDVWDLVDYPSITFPVILSDPTIDVKDDGYVPRNDNETWVYGYYDNENTNIAPVGLQLTGPRMADEKVIEIFAWIQDKIGLRG